MIDFIWEDNSGLGRSKAKTTNKALLVVYNASKDVTIYDLEGSSRDSGAQSLDVPGEFSGDEVQNLWTLSLNTAPRCPTVYLWNPLLLLSPVLFEPLLSGSGFF